MKRFWLVLLSLGLIAAFSTSAMAVDLKFSGEFYAAGLYLDKTSVVKDVATLPTGFGYYPPTVPTSAVGFTGVYREDVSTAFYFQRLRLNTTFIVHPGLFLITRLDAMERAWGAARTAPGTTLDTLSAGTVAENENIAFDLAYITYISPIGVFQAGYQIDNAWGTVFGDNSVPTGKVGYMLPIGKFAFGIQTGKNIENSITAKNALGSVDKDSSFVTAFGRYATKGLEAGILFKFINNASGRDALDPVLGALPMGQRTQTLSSLPYVKAQLGPVALQAEVIYTYGKVKFEDDAQMTIYAFGQPDGIEVQQLSAWVDATADFGMVYVGGTAAYLSGDNPDTKTRKEGGATGGIDWNPCLIMFNSDLNYWAGNVNGYYSFPSAAGAVTPTSMNAPMSNAWFAQGRVGVRPVDKLDIMASLSWARTDRTPLSQWDGKVYGTEIDLTATYKITNNLSYMLGAGYVFTGDYFKADYQNVTTVYDPSVADNFMVINKLTLTF